MATANIGTIRAKAHPGRPFAGRGTKIRAARSALHMETARRPPSGRNRCAGDSGV